MRYDGKKYGLDTAVYVVGSVVRMDFKCTSIEEAEKLFKRILQEEFLK